MSLPPQQSLFQPVLDRLLTGATVQKVFGEPIVANDKTIIPVASVIVGFGGGYGAGQTTPKTPLTDGSDRQEGQGGGLGGGLTVRPKGFIEVTPTSSRYVPLWNTRTLVLGFALGLIASGLLRRRKD
ncbi:spore germination protein GerW family protein [Spirosoma gilvum]